MHQSSDLKIQDKISRIIIIIVLYTRASYTSHLLKAKFYSEYIQAVRTHVVNHHTSAHYGSGARPITDLLACKAYIWLASDHACVPLVSYVANDFVSVCWWSYTHTHTSCKKLCRYKGHVRSKWMKYTLVWWCTCTWQWLTENSCKFTKFQIIHE